MLKPIQPVIHAILVKAHSALGSLVELTRPDEVAVPADVQQIQETLAKTSTWGFNNAAEARRLVDGLKNTSANIFLLVDNDRKVLLGRNMEIVKSHSYATDTDGEGDEDFHTVLFRHTGEGNHYLAKFMSGVSKAKAILLDPRTVAFLEGESDQMLTEAWTLPESALSVLGHDS